jgi:threonine synthase
MRYRSTRGGERDVTPSMAVLKGLAADGGLFMPEEIPAFDFKPEDLKGASYQEIAFRVMRLLLDDFDEDELRSSIDKAYATFDCDEVAPITKADGVYYLELYHGKTIAFKDIALSILPYLMTMASKKNGTTDKIVILTATSGDTGKAAMAGFADVPGTGIVVFFPKGGVSKIQELQMRTQEGSNTCAVAIHGNFDDAQTGVKKVFGDHAFGAKLKEQGVVLSSANSINIGRLVPQISYYVASYVRFLENGVISAGDEIDVCVPTGNFGNILAAFLAKKMGLPIRKLICASNDNKVLYDFFTTGTYDKNRKFILTTSPSMDILISSNLERLIWLAAGGDDEKNAQLMKELSTEGKYTVTDSMKEYIRDFEGGYATESEVAAKIKDLYEKTGYVIDTHTAVASAVYDKLKAHGGHDVPVIIASTASPYKFSADVVSAITGEAKPADEFEAVDRLHALSGMPVPETVERLRTAPIRHNMECDIDVADIEETVLKAISE